MNIPSVTVKFVATTLVEFTHCAWTCDKLEWYTGPIALHWGALFTTLRKQPFSHMGYWLLWWSTKSGASQKCYPLARISVSAKLSYAEVGLQVFSLFPRLRTIRLKHASQPSACQQSQPVPAILRGSLNGWRLCHQNQKGPGRCCEIKFITRKCLRGVCSVLWRWWPFHCRPRSTNHEGWVGCYGLVQGGTLVHIVGLFISDPAMTHLAINGYIAIIQPLNPKPLKPMQKSSIAQVVRGYKVGTVHDKPSATESCVWHEAAQGGTALRPSKAQRSRDIGCYLEQLHHPRNGADVDKHGQSRTIRGHQVCGYEQWLREKTERHRSRKSWPFHYQDLTIRSGSCSALGAAMLSFGCLQCEALIMEEDTGL